MWSSAGDCSPGSCTLLGSSFKTLGSQRCLHEFLSQTCSAHEELLHTQTFGVPGMGDGGGTTSVPSCREDGKCLSLCQSGDLSDNGGHLTVVRIKCQFWLP